MVRVAIAAATCNLLVHDVAAVPEPSPQHSRL